MNTKRPEWKNLRKHPVGGIIDKGGTSLSYLTGSWRTKRPITDYRKCIHCMMCVAYCPENCIKTKGSGKNLKLSHMDYNYCKGCKICANVCPVKCIKIVEEAEFHK